MKRITSEENAICRKVAHIFEKYINDNYDEMSFIRAWLLSQEAKELYEKNAIALSSSRLSLYEQLKKYDIKHKDNDLEDIDAMYWVGYILTYFSFYYKVEPIYICQNYNLFDIYVSFDTLHTLSCRVACEEIDECFRIKNNGYSFNETKEQQDDKYYLYAQLDDVNLVADNICKSIK